MASEAFNSLSGYTIGIPPVPVIDENGNVVTNVLTTGNVAAANFYAGAYYYANGTPLTIVPAGTNSQVQFNNSGNFGASDGFTFDTTQQLLTITNINVSQFSNLGDIANITILGGTDGYFLQTDGNGVLNWAAGGGGGNGSPGGSNTQIQYNDNGLFGGTGNFTFNEVTNTLTVGTVNANTFNGTLNGNATRANTAGTVTASAQPNITSVGPLTHLSVNGTTTSNLFSGNGSGLTNIPAANIVGNILVAQQVSDNYQPNITGVGTLLSLSLDGPLISTSSIAASGNISGGNLVSLRHVSGCTASFTNGITVAGNSVFSANSNVRIFSNVNTAGSANINLGTLSNVHIDGGINGYVISTDGLGNLSWSASGSGNGSPGGSNSQIQYNDNGSFNGSNFLTFDESTNTLEIAGNLIANTFQMGSGIYQFFKSTVYEATTTSMAPNQLLWAVPTELVSGVDFTIISTDTVGNSRQTTKISSAVYHDVVEYNEYASLNINGTVCTFSVVYFPGDIISPPSLQLLASPDTSNLTEYRMMITQYDEHCF